MGRGRHPGWIDILAFHPPTGTLLVIEIKTELEDVGATLRTLEWYAREAETRARQLGWRPRRVVRLLVALATTDVERRIREAKRLLANALPARAEALDSLLAEPSRGLIADGRQVGGGLALIDPLRRRARWLQRAAIDGGRSRRYPDYAGFVSAMDQRSGRKPRRAAA